MGFYYDHLGNLRELFLIQQAALLELVKGVASMSGGLVSHVQCTGVMANIIINKA